MQEENIEQLFDRYTKNQCTVEEAEQLIAIFQSGKHREQLEDLIAEHMGQSLAPTEQQNTHIQKILNRVESRINTSGTKQTKWKIYKPLLIAASLVIITSIGFLFYNKQRPIQIDSTLTQASKILPGSNKATLTLADGSTISLTDAQNGKLAEQAGIKITKTADGQLVYTAEGKLPLQGAGGSNLISTPKGGQYQVILPDGTHVGLNAASSLKYPIVFRGGERRVELVGEAYFEVAHNKNMPFRVKTATQTVEVLGTHFNINAYADEYKAVTTLVEGAVRIAIDQQPGITLKPGQQAINAMGNIVVKPADVETALAWANGKIYFKDADIQSIMRQVSRWYNINIEYDGNIPNRAFNGGISRSSNLAAILGILERSNIHFALKEKADGTKTLVVKP